MTDESGSPLPGVNIIEKGTTNGTVSDSEGNYNLLVASNQSTLVFSFVGTISQEVAVGNQAVINVQLLPDAATLNRSCCRGLRNTGKERHHRLSFIR